MAAIYFSCSLGHLCLMMCSFFVYLLSIQGTHTSWKLRVTRVPRYILSPKFGPSVRGSVLYGVTNPLSPFSSWRSHDVGSVFWLITAIHIELKRLVLDRHSGCQCMSAMSLRRTRRLRSLGPEECEVKHVCFICQLRIHVDHLSRCVSTPCCSVFMHRSCYTRWLSVYQHAVIVVVQTLVTFLASYWKRIRRWTRMMRMHVWTDCVNR